MATTLAAAVAIAALCGGALWTGAWSVAHGPPVDLLPAGLAALHSSDAPLVLAVMGTSLTASANWPEAVATRLAACTGGEVQLVRAAQNGMGSAWGLTQVPRVRVAQPDIVLVEFAINDAHLSRGQWFAASQATHRALIAALREGAPTRRVVLMTMSPAHGLRAVQRPWLAMHYAGYRDLAAETGAGLVDLAPRWSVLPWAARGMADGLHPTDAATQAVILPVLVPWLAALVGADAATC